MDLKQFILKIVHVYFDSNIKFEDFNSDIILIDEKSHENILIYNISYETLIAAKLLGIIRLDKIDRFIRDYIGTRYLVPLGPEKYDTIYNRIKYIISLKSGITCFFLLLHRIDSYIYLPLEKRLTLYNAIILIKSAVDKN